MLIFIQAYINGFSVTTPRHLEPVPTVEVKIDGQVVYESHDLDDIIEQVYVEPKPKTKSGFDFFAQTTARAKQRRG
nr:MAG: hypothetical protein [Bacteriophage sp.]